MDVRRIGRYCLRALILMGCTNGTSASIIVMLDEATPIPRVPTSYVRRGVGQVERFLADAAEFPHS